MKPFEKFLSYAFGSDKKNDMIDDQPTGDAAAKPVVMYGMVNCLRIRLKTVTHEVWDTKKLPADGDDLSEAWEDFFTWLDDPNGSEFFTIKSADTVVAVPRKGIKDVMVCKVKKPID